MIDVIEYILIGIDVLALGIFILLFFTYRGFTDIVTVACEMTVALTTFFVLSTYLFYDSIWFQHIVNGISVIPLPIWGIISSVFTIITILMAFIIIDSSPTLYNLYFSFVLIVLYCFILATTSKYFVAYGISLYAINEVMFFKLRSEIDVD